MSKQPKVSKERVWITKYALTSGVFVADAEVSDTSDRMICVKGQINAYYHGEGRDWHRTRESAIDRVCEMRVAKLTSLRKQDRQARGGGDRGAGMKRVLLDCDGVLAAFVDGWLKLINAQWGTTYAVDDVTDWDVCGSLGISPERRATAKRLISACTGFAGMLDVLPGAIDGVRRLREIAEVYIVTSPWNSHPTWTFDREAWLLRNFNIRTSHIIHTSAKHVCVGDVLVDDKTSTCEEWRAAHPSGVAVLWETPHNRRDLWDGPYTSSWDFLVDLVRGLS